MPRIGEIGGQIVGPSITGSPGIPGTSGFPGLSGTAGINGTNGSNGAQGTQGVPGPSSPLWYPGVGPVSGSGGGSGGADLVQVATGAGSVVIPGLKASPDHIPASPSAYDEEFDTLVGWITLGTLDVLNVTDFASNVHMIKNTSGGQLDGIYKTAPSVPYIVTCKLTDMLRIANFQAAGLAIGDATPTAWWAFTPDYNSAYGLGVDALTTAWSNRTTRGATTDYNLGSPIVPNYLRLIVTSATNVTAQFSYFGLLGWHTIANGINPGLTPSKIALVVSGIAATVRAEALFDWLRFT
jgi:hypothetical protein